jgi:hypothetical protein
MEELNGLIKLAQVRSFTLCNLHNAGPVPSSKELASA